MNNEPIDFDAIAESLMAQLPPSPPPPPPPPDDHASARRRWLADRAQVLLDGRFPTRVVETVRADRLAASPALAHARAFRDAPVGVKHILVLLGGVGAGKTTAAAWLASEVGGSKPGLVRSGSLERAGRYDRDLDEWVTSRTMLVIDDLGVEFQDSKGAYRSILDELIDIAYGARRRLVLTTNLDAAGVADRVGDRIWSRFCASAQLADCGNHDLRVTPWGDR